MSIRNFTLLVLLAGITIAMVLTSWPTFISEGDIVARAEVEDEIYRLVNEERENIGLSALARDGDLDEMARNYSAGEHSLLMEITSALHFLKRNAWLVAYSEDESPELHDNDAREQVDYCLGIDDFRETMFRSDARATGIGVAIVGNKVYYTQVFDVLNACGADGEPVALYENPEAEDPSWEQLEWFLICDDTDKQSYLPDSFICAGFATTLHDNAEAEGIRASYVSVKFADGPAHALNAFNTTDRGIVYIDCTGPGLNVPEPGAFPDGYSTPESYDKVAYIAGGQEYGLISMHRATSFEYDFYEQWTDRWDEYYRKKELYEQTTDPGERQILGWELDILRQTLGDYRWKSMGTVTNYYVHW